MPMYKVAALLTIHNRKEKTLSCLEALYHSAATTDLPHELSVFVTDDGCTDGSVEAIRARFPDVKIIQGNGELFWAEGMRMAWKEAMKCKFDLYLLLNDDTLLDSQALNLLLQGHKDCLKIEKRPGIYVGATKSAIHNKLTYSGSKILNRFLYTQRRLAPNGSYQSCELANANIMMVPHDVTKTIGILRSGYAHGVADYDYSLTAIEHNVPVLVMPEYCGICENDHKDKYAIFVTKDLEGRKEYLYSPLGFDFRSRLKFVKRFFPYRYPFVLIIGKMKVLFPELYLKLFSGRFNKAIK
ncbi:glycosyltransferase family 2 protein [Robertkochia sediminum]|uniref:glycosyltransferase family 2 protein n=1 Tax=Robertkochia sediminum TaxID=2785326 RepID=UPI00193421D0|nr:glycosyltransferase family 2 protein [Robertkochia sediminum]MBL7474045.1 glycosyltransferase family 2 protein [Robertkochia sediminum]